MRPRSTANAHFDCETSVETSAKYWSINEKCAELIVCAPRRGLRNETLQWGHRFFAPRRGLCATTLFSESIDFVCLAKVRAQRDSSVRASIFYVTQKFLCNDTLQCEHRFCASRKSSCATRLFSESIHFVRLAEVCAQRDSSVRASILCVS